MLSVSGRCVVLAPVVWVWVCMCTLVVLGSVWQRMLRLCLGLGGVGVCERVECRVERRGVGLAHCVVLLLLACVCLGIRLGL